jgi:hypothetical protein
MVNVEKVLCSTARIAEEDLIEILQDYFSARGDNSEVSRSGASQVWFRPTGGSDSGMGGAIVSSGMRGGVSAPPLFFLFGGELSEFFNVKYSSSTTLCSE